MSELFEKTTINTMVLENRFVRSATFEGMANDDGSCTQRLEELTTELARGGVGLIISGHSYVSLDGKEGRWKIGVYSDELIPGLTQLTEAVHKAGGKIVMQIAHAGCHSVPVSTGRKAAGPSVMEVDGKPFSCEMTVEEIEKAVEMFGDAAVRAQKAGFDGVQIHAAHGYLLSQFLSRFYNKRTDRYGGGVENRSKIIIETLLDVRKKTGKNYPVLIKINSDDFVEEGLQLHDMLKVSELLENGGADAIEISGGTRYSGRYFPARPIRAASRKEEVYYREAARQFKRKIHIPLILVGGIRSFEIAEELVGEGVADYLALSRPLIREPGLINRWQSGDTRKAACLSDNLCLEAARAGKGVYCVTANKTNYKQ